MKRNLIFSNYDAPQNPFYGGGGARAIHEIARRLVVRHRVRVVTGAFPGGSDEQIDGVEYRRIGAAGAGPRAGQLLYQFLLPGLVRRSQFDVWIESLTPPFSTACLPLFTSQPVIALTQVLSGRAMGRKYHLPFGTIEAIGLKAYQHVIALSPYLKEQVARANPRANIAVIPNGIDRAQIEKVVENRDEYVLFLGRIDVVQKGIDLLLNAYHRVAAVTPVKLVIAGGGAPKDCQYLERRIAELGLTGKAVPLGRVNDVEKEKVYRGAMFFVMPSRFEASPLVLVEAFCHNLPVVLFSIGELAWLPDQCCLKASAFDERALADAILCLINNADLRRRMGSAAKVYARQFDWDDLARQYEDFIESTLSKP